MNTTPRTTVRPSFSSTLPRNPRLPRQRSVYNLDATKRLDPKVTAAGLEHRTAGRAALYERVRLSGSPFLCAPRMGKLADAAAFLGCATEVAAEVGQAPLPRADRWSDDLERVASCYGVSSHLLNLLLSR